MFIPARFSAPLLSLLRAVFGLMFLAHGVSKFFAIPPFPMPLNPLLTVAGVLELVGGGLLLMGLFTRPVAFVLSGQMAVAYFMAHAPQGFLPLANGGEAAILYCFAFLYLAATGGGSIGVDAMRRGS
ncbi:DoxX family protein [Sphingomonas sanguinis]|uniref:DoxX family protein n=1 Tax=Sphingomonas sanguinis TaxID=33051 RepID=A0A147J387_9SPHN|nr:DoxX family protein [Sphingomonas sanguinis]KTW03318.1 DoxX family protein [Sphingomonas sanguinis]